MFVSPTTIPSWSSAGVLPPIRPSAPGNSPDRSPNVVNLSTFVERFAISPERMNILEGLLRFRGELRRAGITSGFQWLDGSFLEQVEILERREPRDMDVVTFFNLPQGEDQNSLVRHYGMLFDHKHVKEIFALDAYFIVLGGPLDTGSVRRVSYWYSLWSHRRDGLWKGFVHIDLDSAQDGDAQAILNLNGGIHHE
jgi:hypothetical protein